MVEAHDGVDDESEHLQKAPNIAKSLEDCRVGSLDSVYRVRELYPDRCKLLVVGNSWFGRVVCVSEL